MVRSQPGGQDLAGSSGISGLPDAHPGMQRRAAGCIAPERGSLDGDPDLHHREYPSDSIWDDAGIDGIFRFLKRFDAVRPAIEYLERRGEKKTKALSNGEFLGLLLFVGIPLPGTGGWTGSLAASLMEMEFRKAIVAIFLGILMATVIMSIVSYGLLGMIIR